MSRWINQNFDGKVCSIAIELKKFFMDEWTGEIHTFGLHRELARVLSERS